jgi:Family of unknown function (DUF5681)
VASDYEVGHGKPPKSTQFKKGQSGNPKGRPKGSKNFATVYHKVGREFVTVKENGRTRRLTKQEAIARRFTNAALTGPDRAIRDYVNITRALPEPEPDGLVAAGVPESHQKVMADIIRRIRDCEPPEHPGIDDGQPVTTNEEGDEQ